MPSLYLDLDVNTSSKVELHQRVHGLWGRINDVQQTLVRPDFKLVARFLVTWGPRRTVNFSILFGSGIGPRTLAPVRLAVFTISACWTSSTR